MRSRFQLVLSLGLALVLAAGGLAQQQQQRQKGQRGQFGFGGGGFGGYATLLQNEGVQKELKLDEGQTAKVKEAVQKVQDKNRDARAKVRDLSAEERRTKGAELQRTENEETLAAVSDALKPEQLKRLKQIELQQAGARAFTRPDVEKALALTTEQKEKIKTISEDSAKELRELFTGGNAQGSREKMASLRKESGEKIQAVLTADQKKTLKELTGDTFEVRLGQGTRQRNKNP